MLPKPEADGPGPMLDRPGGVVLTETRGLCKSELGVRFPPPPSGPLPAPLEFEALLRRGRVRSAGVERAHEEVVAAVREARVRLGRAAPREVRLLLLVRLPLDERTPKARLLADCRELELG